MSVRGQKKRKLARVRAVVARRDERIVEMTDAHRRLQCLYDVSKLLTGFEAVERTVPEVIAFIARTIPLRSSILILETTGLPRTIVWQAEGEAPARMEAAKTHAQKAYGILGRPGVTFEQGASEVLEIPQELARRRAASKGTFLTLPLVVERNSIFGALQIEAFSAPNELDLIFFNAVVNQLALVIDRRAAIDARQASTEAAEVEQRLLAEVSALLGSSLDYRRVLMDLARFVVPRLADVCLVDEVAEEGTAQRLVVTFADAEKERELAERAKRFAPRPGWQTLDARAMATGKPILVSRLTDPLGEGVAHDEEHAEAIRAAGIRSLMAVPLVARERTLGAIVFGAAESGRLYSEHDLALAVEIARRAGIAIDNARLYEQAQRATIARQNLLAIVSHDLKNPLGVILMNLAQLLTPFGGKERRTARKLLEVMHRSANRMRRMIEDLLATASIEAGQFSVERRRVDVTPLVAEALDALQPLAASKSLRLVSELPPELPAIDGDGARLQQVLANLLGNAIKFTDGGGVTVRASPAGDEVVFSVSDTGPGVAAEELPHLFDRFWQAKRTPRLGTGLGLFIVKGIVETHGGRVWAESKIGEGTTFFFTLPVASSDAATS